MRRRSVAAVAAALVTAGLVGLWPAGAGAQSNGSVTLPPAGVLGDCTGALPVIVASDAAAQSDIYSAVTLAGVLGPNRCIVLAGGRDEPFPPDQLARLATAQTGGYVVGGRAAVPDAKLSGRDMTRVYGTDRWETAAAVGTVAAKLAADGGTPAPDDTGHQPDDDAPAWERRLANEFAAALSSSQAPADMCMSLYRNGAPVYEHKAGTPLLPASLIKLATVTAALTELGADATFTTRVVADADALAAASGGVYTGNLYLIGSGDPVLATPNYINRIADTRPYTDVTRLADSVMAALGSHGIHTIDGAVVGDGTWFNDDERDYTTSYLDSDTDRVSPVWKPSYLSDNLSGVVSGLVINDGYSPYQQSRKQHTRSTDSTQAAASDFDDLLEARDLVIRQRPRSGTAPAASNATALGSVTSPTLSEMLVRVLRFSENTPAEMLLKQIGRRRGDSSRAAAAAAASAALSQVLGATADEIVLVDGSGLSVHNRMSCNAAVRLLLRAGADSRLAQSLSIAGRTPTLRSCGPQPPEGGSVNTVYAKGGQLNDSSAIAGVSTAPNGDVLTFAMIANADRIIGLGSCNGLRRLTLNAIGRYTYGPAS